ncbi:MAG: hypothetical protein GY930_18675 [bacterium]|nr:hypothetical protein [bacterium]
MKHITGQLSECYRWIVQPLLVLLVIVFGFLGARGLSSQATPPERMEDRVYAPLVRVLTASITDVPVQIQNNGSLQARTQVSLVPQVGGRVIEIHPGFRAGGSFEAGEILLRIEPRDFELQVSRSQAEVSSAQTILTTLNAEAAAAREEWRLLNGDTPVPTLVGKEPQLLEAQAKIAAAQAALETAELNLSRTAVSLPWNGRIVATQVDVGAVVNPNQPLASAYATDVFELEVPLRQDQLKWIRLPGETEPFNTESADSNSITLLVDCPGATAKMIENEVTEPLEQAMARLEGLLSMNSVSGAGQSWVTLNPTGEFDSEHMLDRVYGSLDSMMNFPPEGVGPVQLLHGSPPTQVMVQVDLSGNSIALPGRVVRIAGELDSMSRFARVVVEIDLSSVQPNLRGRILPGTFAKVEFKGASLSQVAGIPRAAQRADGSVWTVEGDRIVFNTPEVVYADDDTLWIRGIQDGSQVITSDLNVVTQGMQVRTIEEGQLTTTASKEASKESIQ